MFITLKNKKVVLFLKQEFTKQFFAVDTVKCTVLNSDNNFLKISVDEEIYYINFDCISAITFQKE